MVNMQMSGKMRKQPSGTYSLSRTEWPEPNR